METGSVYADFRIDNDVAYTRQMYEVKGALVTNILVKGIAEELPESDLKKYFEDFGEVLALSFNDDYLYNSRSANVVFKNPKSAAKALTFKDHKEFTVTANDAWLQPLTDDDSKCDFTNQTIFLNDLEADILLQIISHLTVKDQIALALSNTSFKCLFKRYAELELKEVSTNYELRPLSAYQLQQYFLLAGKYIEMFALIHCHINMHLRLYAQLLMKYCPNLKVLLVSDLTQGYAKHLNEILCSNPQLKALFLRGCLIKDECSAAISSLPKLELLTLNDCNYITGHDLSLPKLKQFHIINCTDFEGIFADMPALSTLSWVGDSGFYFYQNFFESLPKHCKNIEVVNVNCSYDFEDYLVELEKLTSINIKYISYEYFLPLLIEQRGTQLQTLGIDCDCLDEEQYHLLTKFENLRTLNLFNAKDEILKTLYTMHNLMEVDLSDRQYSEYQYKDVEDVQVTNEGLLELIKCCNNLKCIKVEHTNISQKFTEDLLAFIKASKRQHGQLTIHVHGTLIKKKYLSKEYFSHEIMPLVQFVFEERKTPFNGNHKDFFEHDIVSITLPEL